MVPFHILQNQNIIKDDWSTALLKKITIPYVTKKNGSLSASTNQNLNIYIEITIGQKFYKQ